MSHVCPSKSWNWNNINDPEWKNPAQEVYSVINRWKSKGYKKVLDLGCGIGRHSILLAENGFDVYRFWEHEINESVEKCINLIINRF